MKRTLKFTALMLVAVLLVINTAIFVSSENAPSMSIDFCNLSFRDSVCIKYAVSSDSSAKTTLLIWDTPATEYLYGTHIAELESVGTQEIDGVTYKIYDYTSLSAKQMTDVVYARAYSKVGNSEYYSNITKYSILQYAYNKLGKTATATSDENLKNLLGSMLTYGANAQTYFEYNTDRLATSNFYQVVVNGGTLDDMCNHGLYLEGEEVNIFAPETNEDGINFAGWTNKNGEVVAQTAEATITVGTANDVYTAIYGELPSVPGKPEASIGLEYESNGDGTCYLIGIGDCTDTDIVIPETSPDGDTVFAIDRNAFADEAITSVTIPTTIEEIGRNAFNGCASLTDVYYLGTKKEWEALCENVASGNTALLNANIHFAEQEVTYDEPTIVVDSVTASAGDTVEVFVDLYSNPGILGMTLKLGFNDEAMTLAKVEKGTALSEMTFTSPKGEALKNGCELPWDAEEVLPEDVTNGNILKLTFEISDTAEIGDYDVTLSYNNGAIIDNDMLPVNIAIINGKVSIA